MNRKNFFSLLLILFVSLIAVQTVFAVTYDFDTGFRPETDGFSFPNYGNQICNGFWDCTRPQNLTSVEMRRMFGDQVCKTVYADGTCDLLRVASSWMNQVNQTMSGGHCEGMAVLSSLFYGGLSDPAQFGGRGAYDLKLGNNPMLQRELAYWFATQWFMDGHLIENDPTSQLKLLAKIFQENPNRVIPIGIYKRDMTGGHAITAYAIEEKGNGIYWIMVYDNNYPDEERYIVVDTRNNTWTYQSATMSGLSQDVYDGVGRRNQFQIAPVDSRLGKFTCDFCPPSSAPNYDNRGPIQPPSPDYPSFPVSPAEPAQPSGEPSIFDILVPWLFPELIPTSTPVRPTPAPTDTPAPNVQPDTSPAPPTKNANKITVNKDSNIYIETDADQRAGYDWQDGNTYDDIRGVSVTRSVFRSSANIPNNLKYYVWINPADQARASSVFDVEITSPGTVLRLENMMSSYKEPNFVYNPPTQSNPNEVRYEAFEIMADPDHLPRIEFNISDKNGEYRFLFLTKMDGGASRDLPIDFIIYHDYDYSQIGIWIAAANKEQTSQFRNALFEINAEFYLWDDQNERFVSTRNSPITMDINGMFFFNYKNWLEGKGNYISADLEGNGDFESWIEIQ